jgi:hypothetical protein
MTIHPIDAQLLSVLESEERFRPLARFFLERAIEELFSQTEREVGDDSESLAPVVKAAFELILERCHALIGALSESPIEQVFLRSLALSFLRNGQCLVFMQAFRNTMLDLPEWHGSACAA